MKPRHELRQKLGEVMQTIAGALIAVALVALAVWACGQSLPDTGTGCNRAECVEPGSGDGPDHPDLEDVYDYDPLDDQMRQQQLDDAVHQQELEDARQEGYDEGYDEGYEDGYQDGG
ncbi:hypothetical protein [Kibdelosporangium aridum]|uniref:hypothetical protein n=1 Tax=Kibdelosporangium aridum TaxID=2030 RepID=UPI00052622A1